MKAVILLVVLAALEISQAQRFGFQQQTQKPQQSSFFGQQNSFSSRSGFQQQTQKPQQSSFFGQQNSFSSRSGFQQQTQKPQQSSFFGQQNSFSSKSSFQQQTQRPQQSSFFGQQNSFSSRNIPQVPQHTPTKSSVSCPEKNGRFPTRTCDGYIECEDGVGEEKLCADGLLFNAKAGIFSFPCQYPIDVDCSGRASTQPAQSTEDCPHQYGYYRLGDAANCGQFKNCVDGRAYTFDCPEGLAFNDETYRCDWPDQVKTCDAEAYLGFSCPDGPDARGIGFEDYRSFRSPRDCQRYFICIDTKPRLYNCGEGKAFNELINSCDGLANVTGCAGSSSNQFDRKQQPQHNSNRRFF